MPHILMSPLAEVTELASTDTQLFGQILGQRERSSGAIYFACLRVPTWPVTNTPIC